MEDILLATAEWHREELYFIDGIKFMVQAKGRLIKDLLCDEWLQSTMPVKQFQVNVLQPVISIMFSI